MRGISILELMSLWLEVKSPAACFLYLRLNVCSSNSKNPEFSAKLSFFSNVPDSIFSSRFGALQKHFNWNNNLFSSPFFLSELWLAAPNIFDLQAIQFRLFNTPSVRLKTYCGQNSDCVAWNISCQLSDWMIWQRGTPKWKRCLELRLTQKKRQSWGFWRLTLLPQFLLLHKRLFCKK